MIFELSVLIKATILLMCTTAVTSGFRRSSASMRHTMWAISLFAVLVLPLGSAILPSLDLTFLSVSRPEIVSTAVESPDPGETSAARVPLVAPALSSPQVSTHVPLKTVARSLSRREWFGITWVVGVLVVIGRSLVGIRDVRRLRKNSRVIDESGWLASFADVRRDLGVSTPIELRIGGHDIPPMTWGTIRPAILFPDAAATWPLGRLRMVMVHELTHVKRRDGLMQLIIHMACCLYWFHPLVWYAAYCMRIERERACDDHVLNLGADADEYAENLFQIARDVASRLRFAPMSIGYPSQLEARLRAILDSNTRRQTPSRFAVSALVTLTLIATLLISTIQTRVVALPLPIPRFVMSPTAAPAPMPPPAPAQITNPATADPMAGLFVKIPTGEFTMGCTASACLANVDQLPAHLVRITKSIEMGKYEVTQAQWQSLMGTNPSEFKGANHPVDQVSWNDIQEFLKRLNEKADGYRYRLPTEAEWEYAAKAGTTGHWGPRPTAPAGGPGSTETAKRLGLDAIAWCLENAQGSSHPVGLKEPNAWGLYDMYGNVWEWVEDWYNPDYYSISPTVDPSGPASGQSHPVKGGSWDVFSPLIGDTNRNATGPNARYDFIGFRMVREVIR